MTNQPLLYCILDLGYVAEADAERVTAALLAGGADLLQLRAKGRALDLIESVARRVLRYFRVTPQPDGAAREARVPRVDLTERERDVLRLIGKGYRVLEVSDLLGISAHTVTSYVRDIYRKLGISSRAEAATEAIRRGLVG